MQKVIIKDHLTSAINIKPVPKGSFAGDIVEKWQKAQTCYLLRGQLNPCTWIVSESNFIDCIIQGAKL